MIKHSPSTKTIPGPNLPTLDAVIADIDEVLKASGLNPEELTVTKYSKLGGAFDGRMLRRLGGFQAILDKAFRSESTIDVSTSRFLQRHKSYVNKLERTVADAEVFKKSLLDGFKEVWDLAPPVIVSKISRPPVVIKHKSNKRANGVLISDIHLGLTIDPEEVMTNGYNWKIAARRLGKLTEQVGKFREDDRSECEELHVCLGGDLGQGVIHLSDNGTDLITYQINGICYYITQMIDAWRHKYNKIYVHCTPDNHLRVTHKGPDRAPAQKFDAWSGMIHMALQLAFRGCPEVKFDVVKSAITTFDVLGHKFGLTHGDTHVNSGNIGQSVNVKSITNQVLRLNAAAVDKRGYDALLMGHVHVPLFMHLNETGTQLVINGTGSGTDPYAESIGYFRTRPTQVMWETTKDYAIGDFRMVDMSDADSDARFETIIKPYEYGLVFSAAGGMDFPKWKV